MNKSWGILAGVAAAVAAGVYVLWGPITERKKRKRGKNQHGSQCDIQIIFRILSVKQQIVITFFRHGSRSAELWQLLLLELFASGFGGMSFLYPLAREICKFAQSTVMQG